MATLQTLTLFLTFSLLACNSNKTKSNDVNTSSKNEIEVNDSPLKPILKDTTLLTDTFKRFVVDDYPVTYEMMAEQKVDNSSSYTKTSGKTKSFDKAWFSNDTLKQTLIFELYTDGHRLATYHFYNNDIPAALIDRVELHTDNGEIANNQQKENDFNGFLKQSVKIEKKYFKTDKGLLLGDSKQKAISFYGQPHSKKEKNGIETLEWDFVGDLLYDGKENLKGKPLAKDNYGHQAYLFFRNGKLIGQMLHNDIP
jgi:hypothetical protein